MAAPRQQQQQQQQQQVAGRLPEVLHTTTGCARSDLRWLSLDPLVYIVPLEASHRCSVPSSVRAVVRVDDC
jgi:hypothetical protein